MRPTAPAFEPQADGCYVAALTEKAIEFGEGDDDRIASAAFARFLSEWRIQFDWLDSLHFNIAGWGDDVAVRATRSTETAHYVIEPAGLHTVVARVAPSLVAIHAITHRARWQELIGKYGEEVPVFELLHMRSWLRAFPHLWTPNNDEGIRAWQQRFNRSSTDTSTSRSPSASPSSTSSRPSSGARSSTRSATGRRATCA